MLSKDAAHASPGLTVPESRGHEMAGGLLTMAAAQDFQVEDVAGAPGTPVPLKITLPANPAEKYSFLMIRNLPPEFGLSSGFGVKDYWAVSLQDLGNLKLIPAAGFSGAFTMEVLLVRGMGAEPERRTAKVVLTPEGFSGASDSRQLLTATPPGETTAALPPFNPPRDAALNTPRTARQMTEADRAIMERGNTLMKQGDVAAARLVFRLLAKRGIPEGAFAMGNSYDPEFLARMAVRGLQPDIDQAKNWYRMAEELGSDLAAGRLAALSGQGN